MDDTAGGSSNVQSFAFNPSDKHANITLSNSDKTASTTSGSGHFWAGCTIPKTSGKWIVEFYIDAMPASTGNIAVGVGAVPGAATPTADTSYPSVRGGPSWWVRKSSAASRFYYSSSSYDTLTPATDSFNTGDTVTITLDFATHEVKVYRNGTLIYTKIVVQLGMYASAPVVKLWGGVGAPATVSIPTIITYPVSGFTAWA